MPASTRSSVVLPAPLAPMMATRSPARMSRLTSFSAETMCGTAGVRRSVTALTKRLRSERSRNDSTGNLTETLRSTIWAARLMRASQPIRHAVAVFRVAAEGDDGYDDRIDRPEQPLLRIGRLRQQRPAHEVEQRRERIGADQPVERGAAQGVRGPDDRRQEEDELQAADDRRADIAKARAEHAERDRTAEQNDEQDRKAGHREQHAPMQRPGHYDIEQNDDHQMMREDEHVAR